MPNYSSGIVSPDPNSNTVIRRGHINPEYARCEVHRVWVGEATLKAGLRHAFSKRVFYVDEDSWSIAAVDCYDGRGQLWRFQEAHLSTFPFVPVTTGSPDVHYDLPSGRSFVTGTFAGDASPDFGIGQTGRAWWGERGWQGW